jgi:hypothetical protein
MKSDSGLLRVALALLPLLGASDALAHHSTSAEFDQDKPTTFTGTVKRVLWTNPHIYTHVEVTRPDGSTFIYHVEGGSPNTLFRQGWRKESVQVGETVTVTGWRAKNPQSPNVGQATITTADGQRIYSGSAPARAPD